jgi:hypothetical protein
MVPLKYPELKRVIIMVKRPIMGPKVAIKAVTMPSRAPKQRIVAKSLFERISTL